MGLRPITVADEPETAADEARELVAGLDGRRPAGIVLPGSIAATEAPPGVDFTKPFRPKITDKM
jgi:hypothetical protein